MIILLDMDGVLADTDTGFVTAWQRTFGQEVPFDVYHRKHFFMSEEDAATTNSPEAMQIFQQQGFFENLTPKHGALDAVKEMHELGHQVFILTSAGIRFPRAASEKYAWVAKHFGDEMVSRLIITPAKHMVRGDILIDDRPDVPRSENTTWEHVLFDTSYNQGVQGKRRLTWDSWKDVLGF